MMTSTLTINVDPALREQAESLFSDLGLSMGTAITAFLKQAVNRQEIPFRLSKRAVFNEESQRAFEECEDIIRHPENYKTYTDVNEMFREILSEEQGETA